MVGFCSAAFAPLFLTFPFLIRKTHWLAKSESPNIPWQNGPKPQARSEVAMGQKPIPPLNIRFNPTTKIPTKIGGEFTYQPKWDPIGF